MGTWSKRTIQWESKTTRTATQSTKGYFTEIEIVRLYNELSNKGKDRLVEYARDMVQKEKTQPVISVSENLYEYHVYEKMSAGIGASVMMIELRTLFILMRN